MSTYEPFGTSRRGRLSRRRFLEVAGAIGTGVAGASLLSSCSENQSNAGGSGDGDAGAQGDGVLRVAQYAWIANGTGDWFPNLKSEFEEANPGVTVEFTPLASDVTSADSLVQKLSLEARRDEASFDLIIGPTPWVEVGALAKANAILPLDDVAPQSYFDRLITPARQEATAPDGKTYCMPFWSDVVGFLDRVDVLQDHGVEPPETWEDLIAMVESLQGVLPSDSYPYGADWTTIHRMFVPLLSSLTEDVIAENGAVNMATAEAGEALEILQRLQQAMPPNANQPGGAIESFQAGKVATLSYWTAGYQGAINSGLDEEQVNYRRNLIGNRESTFFWDVSGVIPIASAKADLAAKFLTESILGEEGLQQAAERMGRIAPVRDAKDHVDLPEWLERAYDQLETGTTLPCNDAFITVEGTTFKTEVERMVLEGTSPAETQQTLNAAFSAYEW